MAQKRSQVRVDGQWFYAGSKKDCESVARIMRRKFRDAGEAVIGRVTVEESK